MSVDAGWPRVDARTRLLVVAPHPDDETLAAGESIQRVLAADGAVRVLLLTDGDDNPWPQRWLERRLHIDAAARRRWGRRRRAEAVAALARLGAPAGALHALGWPDMGLTALLHGPVDAWREPLLRALDEFRPDTVLLPALSDRHPDHGAAHVLMRLALAAWRGAAPRALAYLVHGREAVAEDALAAAPDAAGQHVKQDALACHRTQMALSADRLRRLAARAERFAPVRSGDGSGRLPWRPGPAWRRGLRLSVAGPDGCVCWRWSEAPLRRGPDGGYRLVLPAGAGPRFAKLHLDLPSPWIFDRWGWREL